MNTDKKTIFRLESIFAGMHSTYWLSMCAFSGFMAVYLSYYGFSDSLVGITASLTSLITIAYQLGISSFSDAHSHVSLKRIITLIYLVILMLVAVLALVPLPIVLLMLAYSLAGGLANGMPGLYNAQIMQFVNAGIPVNFGWPRGVSAILYAAFAYLLGLLLESYSPSILMPIVLVCIALATLMVLVTPRPEHITGDQAISSLAQPIAKTSLVQMLKASRVMQLFLLSGFFMSAGQSNMMLFLYRVVESKGGGEAALGLAMFLQAGVEMPAMILSPFILKRFRARAVLSFSVTFYFIKALIIFFAGNMFVLYIAMVTSIFCFGLYGVASVYFVNSIVRQNEKVRAQSLISVFGALAAVLGNLTAGWVVQNFGIGSLNLICVILQLIAAGLMILCANLHADQEKQQLPKGSLPFPLPFIKKN